MQTRPRRSMLFMPATNSRAIEKSQTLPVDSIILDLEDSVPPSNKVAAREQAIAALSAGDFKYREVLVRINSIDSDFWLHDVSALSPTSVDGIVVPKVERITDLEQLFQNLDELDWQVPVWIMLETPLGVLSAGDLCQFQPASGDGAHIAGVLLGTADLSKSLNMSGTQIRQNLQTALCQCVLAARAANLVICDGVFMNVQDASGLEQECVHGKSLGFDGKTLIHPAQLEITNRVFSPDGADVEHALALIEAWESALDKGDGVCLFNGSLVEHLHVDQARQLVDFYNLIQQRC